MQLQELQHMEPSIISDMEIGATFRILEEISKYRNNISKISTKQICIWELFQTILVTNYCGNVSNHEIRCRSTQNHNLYCWACQRL